LPINLHILGQNTGADPTSFNAQGVYINDDGVTLNLINKQNQYSITAQNSASGLSINIFQTSVASNYLNATTQCSAVNQNDFVSTIYFYNGEAYGLNQNYNVTATLKTGQQVQVGKAIYDTEGGTDRLVFTASAVWCLSAVQRLDFIKTA